MKQSLLAVLACFQEMIQNAEDAGAREIKILYEHRQCSNEKDLAQLEAPTHMKALKVMFGYLQGFIP